MKQATPPPRELRAPALDGLRAVAIAGVLAVHAKIPLLSGGGIGVYLFFSLSGYLITTLLLREIRRSGRIDALRFYSRRALRLLPALGALLAACAVATHVGITAGGGASKLATVGALFYFANWLKAFQHSLGWLSHMWSLSVEEQFYLLWPLALVLLMRLRGRRIALAATAVLAVAALMDRVVLHHGVASADRILQGTDTLADQLMFGCAVALLLDGGANLRLRRAVERALRVAAWPAIAVLALTAVLLPATVTAHPVVYAMFLSWGLSLLALCSAIIVGFVAIHPRSRLGRLLSVQPLPWLGRISYSLYLWHYPVFLVVNTEIRSVAAAVVVEVLASLLLASASHYVVERPALALRRRLADREATGIAQPQHAPAVTDRSVVLERRAAAVSS